MSPSPDEMGDGYSQARKADSRLSLKLTDSYPWAFPTRTQSIKLAVSSQDVNQAAGQHQKLQVFGRFLLQPFEEIRRQTCSVEAGGLD
jgi:hypothetical protein